MHPAQQLISPGPAPPLPDRFAIVRPGVLWRSSHPSQEQLRLLAALGGRLWVDLRAESDSVEAAGKADAAGLEYLKLGIADNTAPTLRQFSEFLSVVGRGGGIVVVACAAGCGRSGCMTIAYQVAVQGKTLREAIDGGQAFAPRLGPLTVWRAFTSAQLHGLRAWALTAGFPLGEE